MSRCFYSEGLCLYWFVCLAFRWIICEGPILTSVPKQFGSFSYSLHILLSQLSPVLFSESPTWSSQGRSCLWNLRDAPFCSAVNVRIITACCFFWGFTWLFRHRNTAVSCCLQKEASLFHRSEAQIRCESEEILSHWLSCWRCGLLMKELYVKIIVEQVIMWRLIYDVGSVWWLLLLKVLRFISQARGNSSWDLRRWSCKDEVNVP